MLGVKHAQQALAPQPEETPATQPLVESTFYDASLGGQPNTPSLGAPQEEWKYRILVPADWNGRHIEVRRSRGLTELVVDGRVYGRTEGIIEREHTISARIDGHDVRQVTQESLRQNVGVVQQDVFLFAASILENIRYGKPGASEEEVARAAKLAEIYDDIVALPEGFNTYVGERGTLLSGGQKQRISIARIFLKDPPVLILDEATSALDSVTEAKLQETFEKLAHGRTTIIIAHRLSTVRNADRIAVIEDGRITELGSHDQLMAKNGAYAELVRTQELIGHGKE